MPSEEGLRMYVIYEKPADFPEHFVVRGGWAKAGYVKMAGVAMLFETLEEARAAIPPGHFRMPRSPEDPKPVVETWL